MLIRTLKLLYSMVGIILLFVFWNKAKEKWEIDFQIDSVNKKNSQRKEAWKEILFYAISLFYFVLVLLRINHGFIWLDEGYTIALSKMKFAELIETTAGDVHPPLYYLIVKVFSVCLGHHQWVYELSSVLPVAFSIMFSVFVMRKEFGRSASVYFMTLLTCMNCSFDYMNEVRMYSWANFLVLMCFWCAYQILKRNKNRDYVFFVLFGLAGAYTHYYAMVTVGLVYVLLFVVLLIRADKKKMLNWLFAAMACAVGYLPWVKALFSSFGDASSGWWATEVITSSQIYDFIFWNRIGRFSYLFLGVCILIVVWKSFISISVEKREGKDKVYIVVKGIRSISQDNYFMAVMIGLFALVLTYFVGYGVSVAIRPLFQERFIYPAVGILWFVMATSFAKTKSNKEWMMIAWCILYVLGMLVYADKYKYEANVRTETNDLVNYIEKNGSENDVVGCGRKAINRYELSFYFQDIDICRMDEYDFEKMSDDASYWLFSYGELSDDEINEISNKSLECEYIRYTRFAENSFYVYRITK